MFSLFYRMLRQFYRCKSLYMENISTLMNSRYLSEHTVKVRVYFLMIFVNVSHTAPGTCTNVQIDNLCLIQQLLWENCIFMMFWNFPDLFSRLYKYVLLESMSTTEGGFERGVGVVYTPHCFWYLAEKIMDQPFLLHLDDEQNVIC